MKTLVFFIWLLLPFLCADQGFVPEQDISYIKPANDLRESKDHPDIPPQEVLTHFMEEAQKTASWSAFVTTATALGLGFDPVSAHSTARNAVDHNFLQTIPIILCASILMEYPQYLRDLETDEPHVALSKLGIGTIEGTAVGMGVGCAFTVGGMAYRTLREAMAVAVAKNPLLKNACAVLETRLGKIEVYVKEQFRYFPEHIELRKASSEVSNRIETSFVQLEAPQMADHHIFPQQFKKWFAERKINIDLYTISVPHQTTHLKGIHGRGNANMPGGWNQRWAGFVETTPDATAKDIYQFAGQLMDEYGINHLGLHGYKL